jgi:two-component system, LuxR family, sensor kinase FixL
MNVMILLYFSHEIRTPLSVCKLGLDLVQSEMSPHCSAECVDNLRDCQDSIDIAVSILNDLLSYEKLESGIMVLYQDMYAAMPFISKTLSPFSLQVNAYFAYYIAGVY